jgi:hypothetical protein
MIAMNSEKRVHHIQDIQRRQNVNPTRDKRIPGVSTYEKKEEKKNRRIAESRNRRIVFVLRTFEKQIEELTENDPF